MGFHQRFLRKERGERGCLPRFFRKGLGALLGLFYPSHCAACGVAIEEGEEGRAGDNDESVPMCDACFSGIRLISGHCCPVCSHSLAGTVPCPNCAGRRWHLSGIIAAARYEGVTRELIQRLKYGRDPVLARPLGILLGKSLSDPRIAGKDFAAVVPVPLHPLREREREFNQARLLAGCLSRAAGLPVRDLLKRIRVTPPQAGFDRGRRMENLRGAFAPRRALSEGSSLLLVDDVATTGATLDACAEVLMEAGAGEVFAVVVARG